LRELHEDLKREEIHANEYRDLEHLRAHMVEFIDQYYNRVRPHSGLGYKPPEAFEQAATPAPTRQDASMSLFRHREIYRSYVGLQSKRQRAEAGSPDHRLEESQVGYFLAGCSPAEPGSASLTADHYDGQRLK
jgi:hypothetical protein